jgi:hypothetical protein
MGFTPNQFNTIGAFPDRVAGKKIKYDERNPSAYFDPTSFTVPGLTEFPATFPFPATLPSGQAYGYIGNLGRGVLTGPGNYVWNFVLAKKFPITERFNLNFRSELFNLLNRPNFSQPNATLFQQARTRNPDLARILTTDGTAREIQFGLKLEF